MGESVEALGTLDEVCLLASPFETLGRLTGHAEILFFF
jgi:hypothetical protein